MKGSGLFFLTSRPSLVRLHSPDSGDLHAWQFSLLERTKRGGVQPLMAYWKGNDGALFVQIHAARLVGGCALNVELERVRPHPSRDGLEGFITGCSFAPERWPSYHAEPCIDSPNQPRPVAANHP